MHEKYQPHVIEEQWQRIWQERQTFKVRDDGSRPRYYMLEMLPYPSGRIHLGHVRNYSIGDAVAWYKRLRGYDVLHPMGWDAFGLPAENAAIKHGARPDEWTFQNIATMRAQLQRMGFSYDWGREIATCHPDYYRWNQWMFIQLFKRGLVYRKRSVVNWCPKCNTSLANEQAEGGFCWRHEDTPVEQRELEQWFVRQTHYAEELLAGIEGSLRDGWPGHVLKRQQDWIGRSEGAEIDFTLADDPTLKLRIFTTRLDTIYGANAVIVAPEHGLMPQLLELSPVRDQVEAFVTHITSQSLRERTESREKEGVDTGLYAINPFNAERLPVWTANFVLAQYGTGALMSVPAHDERDFEFSRKYGLPIRRVIWDVVPSDPKTTLRISSLPFLDEGQLGADCGPFSGLSSDEARSGMARQAEAQGFGKRTTTYRLRDWGISRQRAWGTPIPMIHCEACGTISPEAEENLPVLLPPDLDFSTGAPLATHPTFTKVTCPNCGAPARRDTDTMDTFVDSNWYYFRYCDPRNAERPFNREVVHRWTPVDFYIGGDEHAVMHLIYTRAWTMMMRDIGLVDFGEPVKRLLTQGMVILNGAKMSKSLGNIVDPDEMIRRYGADATRLSILFAAPPEREVDWKRITDEHGEDDYPAAEGAMRYLARVWRLAHRWHDRCRAVTGLPETTSPAAEAARRATHQALARATDAFENGLRLNVVVATCMELTNALYDFDTAVGDTTAVTDVQTMREGLEALTTMLAPLAPHTAEALWQALGHETSLAEANWMDPDPDLAREPQLEIPVQVNGKLKSKVLVAADSSDADLEAAALADAKIQALTADKTIAKVIVVPKRLVNVVIR
ncbi:MAG: leucine--tRNA ligase [Chloracidobacterium sp.]|uniref:Leucine--tRNA ligase n=1 Tax=Chloracidobacterium validum TaxID=2821543 RepID=A0ABX8B7E7_9BACT|nr:leucine--tRNA ligase [Chloracidobacterium validum]QUW02581.1 leucine--tRNA ligase [Chloracidobacterium validum]